MHRSVKIISVIVAACISLIYIGSFRVKAVSSAVFGLSGLIACIECLGSSIIGSSAQIAVDSNSGVSLDDFGLGTSGGSASLTSDQLMSYYLSSIDPSEVAGMSDQEALIYVTDPDRFNNYLSEYISSPVSIGVEYGCKSYLSEVHLAAEQGKVISDFSGLVLSPSTFSDIVNSVSSDVISGVTGKEASVSFLNGIRNISIVDTEDHYFPELCERFGAVSCIRAYSTNHEDYYNGSAYLVSRPYSGTHYFVGVMSNLNRISFPAAISYHSPTEVQSKNLWSTDTILSYYIGLSLDGYRSRFIYTAGFFVRSVYSDGSERFVYFSTDDGNLVSPLDRVYINSSYRNISLSFDDDYLFEFDDYDKASAFSDYLAGDVGTYNPDDDVYTGDDVITTDIPGTVPEAVADYYGGEKDIIVSPGAVKADDGTTTYDPSITIDDTDVQDVVDTPDFNEWVEQNNFVPALSNPDFELYDQCKELLNNLFNYNDVNTPPSFKFYYDSNNDGISETYDVLDLSVLETTLSNDNMQDKSWWGTDIKVIDVIRYVIAAILYGLFIMRLIKRLPTFYGSGPWADM